LDFFEEPVLTQHVINFPQEMPTMNVVGLILGGGEGRRLQPLTRERSKPAVPLAGKYRLVDIPISNCINSGIYRIFLLTQFNSESLHRHVQGTYQFDHFHEKKFVRLLAAQQTTSGTSWYQGTADAVRKTFAHFLPEKPDYVAILSGDQLYRLDFTDVLAKHVATKADVTICTKPVPRAEAGSLGILRVDQNNQIVQFVEKPGDSPALTALRAPMYDKELFLASMGIYVFNTSALLDLLNNDFQDFGKQVIPSSIGAKRVFSYIYEGYWRDIGTIGSFWEANLSLCDDDPEMTFYDARMPIYTRSRYLPPSRVNNCTITRSMLTEGCIVNASRIHRSIIGIRQRIGEGTQIEESVLMGADHFPEEAGRPLGIGKNCIIKKAIVDKNVFIGDDVVIDPTNIANGTSTAFFSVQDGVAVIPKGVSVPAGTKIV
jgi:glucose-1-phosphate adenylyltransferase